MHLFFIFIYYNNVTYTIGLPMHTTLHYRGVFNIVLALYLESLGLPLSNVY